MDYAPEPSRKDATMPTRLPVALRNARANTAVDALDAGSGPGTVKVYSGAQPATADTAASGTLLATIVLPDPAFPNASGGVATGNDPAPVAAIAAGVAAWFRAADSAGVTVHDGTVTATGGGGQFELSTTTLVVGQLVDVTAYTWTEPA